MLTGLYPVLVLQKVIDKKIRGSFSDGRITSTSIIETSLSKPMPIYIDEILTGIYLISENRKAEFANDTTVDNETGEIKIKQKGLTNDVNLVFGASRNSIGMNILLPLIDVAFENAAIDKYVMSYFNGNTILFRAKIKHFSAEGNNTDNGIKINISLSKEDKIAEKKQEMLDRFDGDSIKPDFYSRA
ncbi:MAG: hypothetical protein LBD46_06580 [Endomicrobium sp.]|jgi:hypothetical protein|nr:hypothetical protein [Endomicrobium sp.]